ncbi:MAG: DNA translocase FtsK 4TM domain-containing protein [candidate division WOR-3 bacterium]|nr:DNA translocase FtsK 4TM domain-containing protein [candidate division WOR-3 bacterium]
MRAGFRAKSDNSKIKIIISVLIVLLIAFILISLISFHFGQKSPSDNWGGFIGSHLSLGLVYMLGYCVYLIPAIILLFTISELVKESFRRFILPSIIWLLGIFLFASIISFSIGRIGYTSNYGGLIGSWFAKLLLNQLGILLTYFIPLFLLYSLVPLIRNPKNRRTYLREGLFIFLLIVLVQMLIARIKPSAYWLPGKITAIPLAGKITNAFINWFRYLTGNWGSLIIIIVALLIVILVFTNVPFVHLIANIYHSIISSFKKIKPKKRTAVIKEPISEKSNVPEPVVEGAVQTETETEIIEPPPTKTITDKRKSFIGTKGVQSAVIDEQQFQNEFLASLDIPPSEEAPVDQKTLEEGAKVLLEKLKEFGIEGRVTDILTGPMITRYEFEPAPGIKIQRIESLADDLALSLKAERIRILAPIPGKAVVGIEVPNKYRRIVYLRNILTTEEFTAKTSPLTFALGESITGEPYCADLREMPHVLIAGTTGSGKSVCINTMITSIIFRSSYHDVRFLAIDPKQLELPVYNSIPHLLSPTTIDPKVAISELDRVISIMESRYGIFAGLGVRDIAGYNLVAQKEGLEKKPYIVVVIDELADLMIRAPTEIEEKITRLAQMSRAVGIHLVLATQRPSVDVITGLIKANFPCRIAFQVASKTDSRTILDMNGAEALLGRGDMLFLPPGKGEPQRLHCAYVSAQATKRIVDLWTKRYLIELLSEYVSNPQEMAEQIIAKQVVDVLIDREKASIKRKQQDFYSVVPEDIAEKLWAREYHQKLSEEIDMPHSKKTERPGAEREVDELLAEAAKIVFRHREASVSMLQRRLDIGWARAGRIIDQLEQLGVVGPYVGSKSRKVLIDTEEDLQKLLGTLTHKPLSENKT